MADPWTLSAGRVTLASAKDPYPFPELAKIRPIQSRLESALFYAEDMVKTARMIIQKMAIVPKGTAKHRGNAEVMDTLMKYFNLYPDSPLYDRTVSRIVSVLQAVEAGLSGKYKIFVYCACNTPTGRSPMASAQGFVNVDTSANHALGQMFLSDQHIPWDQVQKLAKGTRTTAPSDDIHLKYEFLERESDEMIAKTLVHEATHKWAYTTDVCYKHSTVAKVGDDIQGAVRGGFQKAVERIADYDKSLWFDAEEAKKPLYPMTKPGAAVSTVASAARVKNANTMPLEMAQISRADMWVKNADSYAWAARRLWKKESIISTAASGGRLSFIDAV